MKQLPLYPLPQLLLVLLLTLSSLLPLAQPASAQSIPTYAAELVSATGPAGTVSTGATAQMTLAYRNTGSTTWLPNTVYVGTAIPHDRISPFHHSSWPWANRPATVSAPVAPGEVAIFTFPLKANVQAGKYAESFKLVAEGITWFGDSTLATVGITVAGEFPFLTAGSETQNKTGKVTLGALEVTGATTFSGTLTIEQIQVTSTAMVPGLYAARAAVADSCPTCPTSSGGGGVAGVSSLRAGANPQLTGGVTLAAGSNITLTQVGSEIQIAASAGGGGISQAYQTTQNGGSALTQRSVLNAGAGLVATDNAGSTRTDLAIDTAVVSTLTDAQTLTNKTLTSPVINTPTGNIVTAVSKSGSAAITGAATFSAGTNVTLTQTGSDIQIAASTGGGGITQAYQTAQSAGSALTQRSVLNAGTGLVATDNAGSTRTDLTIDTTVVPTLTGTQTLTNKTLTSPVLNTPTGNIVTAVSKSGSAAITGAATFSAGTNVTLTQAGSDIQIAATDTGLTQAYVTTQNAGSALTQRSVLNAGTGLTATDNAGSTRTDLAIDTSIVSTLTGSQTLTNKTLTSPVLNTPTGNIVTAVSKSGSAAITGAATFSAGTNVTLTQSGSDIQIAATGTGLTQAYTTAQSGGTGLTQRAILNASTGLVATDNAGSTRTDLAIDTTVVTTLTGTQTLTNKTLTSPSLSGATFTDFAALGATPATAGALRLTNNQGLYSRNAANSANVLLAGLDGSNNLFVGDAGAATVVLGNNWGTFGSTYLTVGTVASASTTGAIRLANNSSISARNAANSADVALITLNTSDQPVLQTNTVGTDSQGFREMPNLILNSDFGRRNKWMTFMPEVFADTSGWTAETGSLGNVASNILTAGTVGNWRVTAAPGMVWRDGRWSASFKAVDTTTAFSEYYVYKWIDASNWVRARASSNSNQFAIDKRIAGVTTRDVVNIGSAGFILDRWYWIELEAQGTTYIAKIYGTGTTVPGTAKSGSTLDVTISTTISDTGVAAGSIAIGTSGIGVAGAFGGLSTGTGGVYVEGWGPESFGPTLLSNGANSAWAVGFDESTDAGPLGKQYVWRTHVAQASRIIYMRQFMPYLAPSTAYTLSYYVKTSGKTGTDGLVAVKVEQASETYGSVIETFLLDAGETTWTRKTLQFTTGATTRLATLIVWNNLTSTGGIGNTTGTVWITGIQLEQTRVATPWRNAPGDDAPISWDLSHNLASVSTSSTTFVEPYPANSAINLFLPWTARVVVDIMSGDYNNTANTQNHHTVKSNGVDMTGGDFSSNKDAANEGRFWSFSTRPVSHYAGKSRLAWNWRVAAGTGTFQNPKQMVITATKGY